MPSASRNQAGYISFVSSPLVFQDRCLRKTYSSQDGGRKCQRVTVPTAKISLPAWEREYELERGLVGTSYETATIDEVKEVGDGFLKITVDTAVTCTSQQYISEGQFLFLKPWGDEDGSIEPCCFVAPPGNGTIMEFFVPEESAVGEAALAGEMLEVSEVMGEGFAPQLLKSEFLGKAAVVAVCSDKFCMPAIAALRNEQRPTDVVLLANDGGPFADMAAEWAEHGNSREVHLCTNENSLQRKIEECCQKHSSIAFLLSADAQVCELTEVLLERWIGKKPLSLFAP